MLDNSALKGPAKARALKREKNTRLKAGLFEYLEGPMNAAHVLAGMALSKPTEPAVLPRQIWMYWHDGWENAPEIAKLCRQSWIARNPGYEVHALDYRSLSQFLPTPLVHYEATKLNSFANRVRLRLLRHYGGVWADATNFCTQAIEPRIAGKVSAARLFAFTLPNAERPIATWFLAATPQSPLMAAWEELIALYFVRIEREQRLVHAYFFMPYIFEFAIRKNPLLKTLWDTMPKVPMDDTGRVAAIAKLQKVGQATGLKPEQRARIGAVLTATPMQKLTWKGAMQEQSPNALEVLDILRENLRDGP